MLELDKLVIRNLDIDFITNFLNANLTFKELQNVIFDDIIKRSIYGIMGGFNKLRTCLSLGI
jgi:hypothetical protein